MDGGDGERRNCIEFNKLRSRFVEKQQKRPQKENMNEIIMEKLQS